MKRSPILLLLTMRFPSHPTTLADTMDLGIRGGRDTLAKHEGYAAGELFPLKELPWQSNLCLTV